MQEAAKATVTVHFKDQSNQNLVILVVEKIATDDFGFTTFHQREGYRSVATDEILYYESDDQKVQP